mmetsp:Transcript_52511/g.162976  ORF Transcript_52511/g.162976 Transcript_52511/m.162976 type:complete len:170 (+) Transcript_52511:90-599(+)
MLSWTLMMNTSPCHGWILVLLPHLLLVCSLDHHVSCMQSLPQDAIVSQNRERARISMEVNRHQQSRDVATIQAHYLRDVYSLFRKNSRDVKNVCEEQSQERGGCGGVWYKPKHPMQQAFDLHTRRYEERGFPDYDSEYDEIPQAQIKMIEQIVSDLKGTIKKSDSMRGN